MVVLNYWGEGAIVKIFRAIASLLHTPGVQDAAGAPWVQPTDAAKHPVMPPQPHSRRWPSPLPEDDPAPKANTTNTDKPVKIKAFVSGAWRHQAGHVSNISGTPRYPILSTWHILKGCGLILKPISSSCLRQHPLPQIGEKPSSFASMTAISFQTGGMVKTHLLPKHLSCFLPSFSRLESQKLSRGMQDVSFLKCDTAISALNYLMISDQELFSPFPVKGVARTTPWAQVSYCNKRVSENGVIPVRWIKAIFNQSDLLRFFCFVLVAHHF